MSAQPASVFNTVPDSLELTRILLRMDTVNPPGNEDQCTQYLAGLLTAAGYDWQNAGTWANLRSASTLVTPDDGMNFLRVGRTPRVTSPGLGRARHRSPRRGTAAR